MTAREQRGNQIIDNVRLADNALCDLRTQFMASTRESLEQREILRVGVTIRSSVGSSGHDGAEGVKSRRLIVLPSVTEWSGPRILHKYKDPPVGRVESRRRVTNLTRAA